MKNQTDSIAASSSQVKRARTKRQQKLKKAVIREDYVKITGNWRRAIILYQFVYWTDKVHDFDDFLQEMNEMHAVLGTPLIPYQNGWIYKKSDQLIEELMLDVSRQTMRKELAELVKLGYIQQRNNPRFHFDRTLQYRVDFVRLALELRRNGYSLEGKVFDELSGVIDSAIANVSFGRSIVDGGPAIPETTNSEITRKQNNTSFGKDAGEEIVFDDPIINVYNRILPPLGIGFLKVNKLSDELIKAAETVTIAQETDEGVLESFFHEILAEIQAGEWNPVDRTLVRILWRNY